MKFDEFMESTQKLCELYGKTMNTTQVEFWFESLKQYEIMLYKIAIGQYAKKNKYMPTISEILSEIKLAKSMMVGSDNEPQEEKRVFPCEKCHGSGLVKYYRYGYEYLCTCNCHNGRSLNMPLLKKFDDVLHCVDNSFSRNGGKVCNAN